MWISLVVAWIGLAFAGWAAVMTGLDRRFGRIGYVIAGVMESVLIAQLVVGITTLAATERDVNGVSFIGYLIGSAAVPPAGVLWARAEPSRWGMGVLVVVGFAVAVLAVRVRQIWFGG
ncbi:MAG: hypothetical protein ACRCTR_09145 [Actinomycetota bacterium]